MDNLTKTAVCLVFMYLLKVLSTSAFECPPVRNQLLMADPEDCRNYYHCLPGGRVYVKTCPKGLVFDAKQKVCVWDSYSSCLTAHQKNELEKNTIVDVPKNKKLPVKSIKKTNPKKQPRKREFIRLSTTTRRPTTTRKPTTTTSKPTTTTRKPTTTKALPKQKELVFEAGNTLGDYPDMAFEDDVVTLNRTEEQNETAVENGGVADQLSNSDDTQAIATYADPSGHPVGNFEDYSSFLFFPNKRLVKRETRREPATYAYKIACPNAFAYVVEPDNCDTFYHCNNWKPFVKRCPPGLYFDATNYVCNWPHNVNCYEGKRTETLFSFNQMRSEKFSKRVVKPVKMVKETHSKKVGYKVNPLTQNEPKTTRVTSKPLPESTTKEKLTTKPETKAPSTVGTTEDIQIEFTAIDNTDFEEGRSDGTIFGHFKTGSSSTAKTPLTKKVTTEHITSPTTTRNEKNLRNNNMDQSNLYLFGKNPFSKPWLIETHSKEPSVRPTLLSKFSYKDTDSFTTDTHRMNPFTKPSYEKYETMRSRNIQTKKAMDEDKEIQRPSIILVDNTHMGDTIYQTTRSRNNKDIYGRINKVSEHTYSLDESSTKSVHDTTQFQTSSIDYSATTSDAETTTASFEATTANDTKVKESTADPSDPSDNKLSTGNFEATTIDSFTQSQEKLQKNKMKIRKALADLEPSKYAAQNLTRVNDTTSTTDESTDISTDKSTDGNQTENTTDALFEATTDKTSGTTEQNEVTDDITTSESTKQSKSIFYSTTMTAVTDNQEENTTTANNTDGSTTTSTVNVTLADNSTEIDNVTISSNDSAPVNISSFRANLEDLIDTYRASFEGISFKSAAAGKGSSSSSEESDEGSDSSEDDKDESYKGGAENTIEGASFAAGKNQSDNLNSTSLSSTKNTSNTTNFGASKNVTKDGSSVNASSSAVTTMASSMAIKSNDTKQQQNSSVSTESFTARSGNKTANVTTTSVANTSTTITVTSKPSTEESPAVTDRSAMMMENKQEVKEAEIDSYMIKKINRGHQPKQSELTPSDNMVETDLNDTPAQGKEKSYAKKTEKWVLFGNADKNAKDLNRKNKTKYNNRYENNETVDDKAAVVEEEEEIIHSNKEDNLDNSIIGFTDGESSGDIDSYRNAIMIDNTDSETKLLQYLSTEEEKLVDHKGHNYFDAPVPYKRELDVNTEAVDSNPTSKSTTVATVESSSPQTDNSSAATNSSTTNETVVNQLEVGSTNNSDVTNATLDQVSSVQNYTQTNLTVMSESYKANVSMSQSEDVENAVIDVSNVTYNNATDSKATMRLTKSSEKIDKDGLVSSVEVKSSVNKKDTPSKKSFISLSDLIKWYLRHWKNYSQFKEEKSPEGDHTNAS